MSRNKAEESRFRRVAGKYNLTASEVCSIVQSYFSAILAYSRTLPFDNARKIYLKDVFDSRVRVFSIPYVGRIGPVYSRYLKWRANVSEQLEMAPRSSYRTGVTQSDIESTAEAILSGVTPPPLRKRKNKEMFERVWLVGQDGKKSARQVIPKKEE